ncbi:MAG: 30S ribosomal protein S4, partial [Candidatus Cloacimonadaceae bacterium]|nr:30S ribosomal protein S4 [Candidatus Cloacimonadaceae bacterium]
VRESSRGMKTLVDAMDRTEATSPYAWITADKENMRGQFLSVPAATEIPTNVDIRLIVEFYSK